MLLFRVITKLHPRRRLNSFSRPTSAPRPRRVLPPPNLSGKFRSSWIKNPNSLASHSPYTLPSSVSRKPFICHSYENYRVCANNSHSGTHPPTFKSKLRCSCGAEIPIRSGRSNLQMRPLHPEWGYGTFQRSNDFSTYPLSFHTLAHSFALTKNSTLLFSSNSALFTQKHPGVGVGIL